MDNEELKNTRDDDPASVPVTCSRSRNGGLTNRRDDRNSLWAGWDPFPEFGRLFSDVMEIFERFSSHIAGMDFYPEAEFTRSDGNLIVKMAIPDVNKNSQDIKVFEDHIILSGKHRESSISLNPEDSMLRREETWGSFFKVLPLPVRVKQDEARIEYKGDVLYITVPEL